MNAYDIAQTGTGFQVIERLPDGSYGRIVTGFPTESAALAWVNDRPRTISLTDRAMRLWDEDPR